MLTGPHKELKNLPGEGLLRAENFIHSVVLLFLFFIYESYSYSMCAYLSDALNGPYTLMFCKTREFPPGSIELLVSLLSLSLFGNCFAGLGSEI